MINQYLLAMRWLVTVCSKRVKRVFQGRSIPVPQNRTAMEVQIWNKIWNCESTKQFCQESFINYVSKILPIFDPFINSQPRAFTITFCRQLISSGSQLRVLNFFFDCIIFYWSLSYFMRSSVYLRFEKQPLHCRVPELSSHYSNTKLRPQVKQARTANKNGRCTGAAHLL